MAISFRKNKRDEEHEVIDSEQVEEGEVVESSEEDEQESLQAVIEKKKKQQRMVIFIAAGVGIAVMMGYWFMTNNAANHSVTARVAQQSSATPVSSPNSQAALVAAQQKSDEEAMNALAKQGAVNSEPRQSLQDHDVTVSHSVSPAVQQGQGDISVQGVSQQGAGVLQNVQGQNVEAKQNNISVGNSGMIGAPVVKVDQEDIVGKVDAMKQFIGESFSTLTSVINKNQTELVSKLDEISQKISGRKKESENRSESSLGGASGGRGVAEHVTEERRTPQVRVSSSWRLSRIEGEYAIIVSRAEEYVVVRKGDVVPGVGRVSEISPERIIAGGVEIRKE